MKKLSLSIIFLAVAILISAFSVCAEGPSTSIAVTDGNVYKNLYSLSGGIAVEEEEAVAVGYDRLEQSADINTTAALTFAVYAPKSIGYRFKLKFTGAEYAAVKTGNQLIKASPDTEFTLKLSKGLNLITCFGAVAEQSGAAIKYSALICENGLNPIEGDFYVCGDINGDKKVDIRDMIRYKKHFAATDSLKAAASDINADGAVNTADMTMLKRYLLGDEEANKAVKVCYELSYVARDNEISDNWNF